MEKFLWLMVGMLMINSTYSPIVLKNAHFTLSLTYLASLLIGQNTIKDFGKYPLKKMLKLASDGIIGFSTKPIKVIGGFGITFVIASIVILLYFILSKIFGWTNMVKGWTSIMFATTFVGGIVLLSLWIIGEYLVRIYDEAKQRPQYIIKKKINI